MKALARSLVLLVARIQRVLRRMKWSLLLNKLGSGTIFWGPVYITAPQQVSVGKNCTFNRNVIINARAAVTIGNHVRIASGVIINAAGLDYEAPREARMHTQAPVVIRDGAWIGAGAIIAPGVTIGEDAAVGAGAVVLKDVAPRTLVFGNPARAVRELGDTAKQQGAQE